MARFEDDFTNDLIHQFQDLEVNVEKMMGEMTQAGAEVVEKNIRKNLSGTFGGSTASKMGKGLKITKTYRTPSDDGIGNFVGFYGYIPFSDKKRKYFSRKGAGGTTYKTDKGVPRDFLAQLYEYGSSNFVGTRFIKKATNKKEIEEAMFKIQDEYERNFK